MEFLIVNLILLLAVLLDATGDAFRTRGKQVIHHMMEVAQIGTWVALWALFDFHWLYILLYTFARFVFFNLTYNLIAGNKWYYTGKSNLFDKAENWIAKSQGAQFVAVIPRIIILVWWLAWILTNANGKF